MARLLLLITRNKKAGCPMPNAGKAATPVLSCRVDASLQRVAEVMWKHNCDYLLVVDTEGRPTGMITDRELCVAAREQDKPLAQIMVSSVADKTVFSAQCARSARAMQHLKIRRTEHNVPILDDSGSLISVVSEDILVGYLRESRGRRAKA
jgi:CBS-domain-containing membrane protein